MIPLVESWRGSGYTVQEISALSASAVAEEFPTWLLEGLQWRSGSQVALIDGATGRRVTIGELRSLVDDAAAGLGGSDDVGPIVLGLSNRIIDVVAYLALARLRGPLVLTSGRSSGERLVELARRFRADNVAADVGMEGWRCWATIGRPGSRLGVWRRTGVSRPDVNPLNRVLLPTSGTRGQARSVRLGNANLLSNAFQIASALGLQREDVAVLNLPLCHAYGLSVLHAHLAVGSALLAPAAPQTSERYWHALSDGRVTVLAGVPTSYRQIVHLGLLNMLPPSVRLATQAGGFLETATSDAVHSRVVAQGGDGFVRMYGQTEATARIAVLPAAEYTSDETLVGHVVDGGEVSIHPGSGEVVYRGPNVMLGYAVNYDDLGRGDVSGGLLHTRDLGRVDFDGRLHVQGRLDDVVKVAGTRVALSEVEHALSPCSVAVFELNDALVICLDDCAHDLTSVRRTVASLAGLPLATVMAIRVRHLGNEPGLVSKPNIAVLRELAAAGALGDL